MDTQWSATREKDTGEWLQFDWDEPQEICAVVLYATGPWIQSLDVQVQRDGSWVSVGHSGSKEERMPEYVVVTFKPERTKSVRFVFDGAGAAFHEVEIYNDPAVAARLAADMPRRKSSWPATSADGSWARFRESMEASSSAMRK